MKVEQHCHVQSEYKRVYFLPVPWDEDQLRRMNSIQNRIPAINSGCIAAYPHTHHFVKVGD